jgi:hypothetical protein
MRLVRQRERADCNSSTACTRCECTLAVRGRYLAMCSSRQAETCSCWVLPRALHQQADCMGGYKSLALQTDESSCCARQARWRLGTRQNLLVVARLRFRARPCSTMSCQSACTLCRSWPRIQPRPRTTRARRSALGPPPISTRQTPAHRTSTSTLEVCPSAHS